MRIKLFILSLILPITGFASIYQSTDTNGTVNFSDTPQSNSSIVSLSEEKYVSDTKLPANHIDLNTQDTLIKDNEFYKKLVITHPKNEAIFLNNKGEINIGVDLKPNLRTQDKLIVLVDNKMADSTQHNKTIIIANIERGTHTLQLQVQDATGRTLLTSETVTFHMQRPLVREVKIQNAN